MTKLLDRQIEEGSWYSDSFKYRIKFDVTAASFWEEYMNPYKVPIQRSVVWVDGFTYDEHPFWDEDAGEMLGDWMPQSRKLTLEHGQCLLVPELGARASGWTLVNNIYAANDKGKYPVWVMADDDGHVLDDRLWLELPLVAGEQAFYLYLKELPEVD